MIFEGAIFDFDGTLFDSMYVWKDAGDIFLRSVNITPDEQLLQDIKTMSLEQSANYFIERYKLNMTAKEIMDSINSSAENAYFYDILPKENVINFLNELKKRNIKMCIATATDKYQIEAALKRVKMDHYFTDIFTCTEVGHGKDEPHIYREAIKSIGTPKENTLIFEDSYHAMETAKKDGFKIVAVHDNSETRQDEVSVIADYKINDYLNFNLLLDEIFK